MSRPAVVALVIAAVVLVGSTGFAVADSDYTITVENGEVNVPNRTENVGGQEFTITSIAPINPGEELDVSVSTIANESYDILLYNSDYIPAAREIGVSGETTTSFETDSLEPGTYSLTVTTGQFETVQPVVITAYETTLSAPSEVTEGNNLSTDIETTEHDNVDAPPIEKVEVVIANDSTENRIEADQTDDGEYVVNTTAEYDPGEYRLYAVVYEDKEVENGELNVISMSGEHTLTVTEQENNNSESSDEDQNTGDGDSGTGGASNGGGGAPSGDSPDDTAETPDDTDESSEDTTEVSSADAEDIIEQQSAAVEVRSDVTGSQARFNSGSPVEEITFTADDVEGTVNVTSTTSIPEDIESPRQMTLQVSEISVPETARNSSARLQMSVSTDRLNQSNVSATDLRVARFTSGTWTTLNTTVIDETTEQVRLEATTPGFSYFAVTAIDKSESGSTDGSDPAADNDEATSETVDNNTDSSGETGSSGDDGTIQPETNDTDESENTETEASTPGFGLIITILSLLISVGSASIYSRQQKRR